MPRQNQAAFAGLLSALVMFTACGSTLPASTPQTGVTIKTGAATPTIPQPSPLPSATPRPTKPHPTIEATRQPPAPTPPLQSQVDPLQTESGQSDKIHSFLSPDEQWLAVINQTAGSLDLQPQPEGDPLPIFSAGSTVHTVTWSPDSRHLLVVRTHWLIKEAGQGVENEGPLEIWQLRLNEDERISRPTLLFQSPTESAGPEQIVFGQWSPNNRYILTWLGILSASILADGLQPWILDIDTGQAMQPDLNWALINPRFQSWAPDSSALTITAGGGREVWRNKWLVIYNLQTAQARTVVSQTERIPGFVTWSPQGDLIAYAAVPAEFAGQYEGGMTFDNPGIAGRRIYLLNPAAGESRRLNNIDAFQDAPTWNGDGTILYYVQRNDDVMVLMAADPATGQAQVIPGTRRPAPSAVGYYGLEEWHDLLAHRPEAVKTEIPSLTDSYSNPTHGFSLHHPAGWYLSDGWQSLSGWQAIPTLTSYPPEANDSSVDFGPFSGQARITIEVRPKGKNNLEAVLDEILAEPGPGQILGKERRLKTFDQHTLTVATQTAHRLETMGDFGVVNHILIVPDQSKTIILRGQGDGRVFDAVAESLQLSSN